MRKGSKKDPEIKNLSMKIIDGKLINRGTIYIDLTAPSEET